MASLLERDARACWHPFTRAGALPPLPVTRAEGAWLYTEEGRRMLDGISSWWVTLHGHAHPAIAGAIAHQAAELEQVIFAGCTHEPAVRLAERLTSLVPVRHGRVFYTDDGSTAVEAALKMALQWWRIRGEARDRCIALEGAYHGDTFGAMSVSARGVFTDPYTSLLFDVDRLPDPVTGDPVAALRSLLVAHPGRHAAIIVEPLLLGAGGMRMYAPSVLRALVQVARESGVLVIADEVLTGFGRTGPLFACEGAGIEPDMLCLSKGITGGFLPLGATIASHAVADAFDGQPPFGVLWHGHSYTANPIACAAALASLDLLDEDCAARRQALNEAHRASLDRLAAHPRVRDARVLGTVGAFDLDGDAGYLSGASAGLVPFARERGVLIRPLGNVVYLMPPYCTTPDELGEAWRVVGDWLEDA